MKILESTIDSIENTASKRYLLSIIKNLADHNHISIKEINEKDDKLGIVWNCLNAVASKQNPDKIIGLLKKLELFKECVNEAMTPEERAKSRAAKAAVRKADKEMLLQIQLMSYDSLIEQIKEKVPTAKWHQFRESASYRGKFDYDTASGIAELWFRNDGMVVCSSTDDPKRTRCEEDTKIFAWIDAHPPVTNADDKPITRDMFDAIIQRITDDYVSEPFKPTRSQEKVIGRQSVFSPRHADFFDIWFRPNGEIFAYTPDGKYYSFNTINRFGNFIKATLKRREEA